jgi:thioredoxin 1
MITVDKKEDLDTLLSKNETVLALFYGSWCPYCINFVPAFDEKTVNFAFGRVIHVLLDDNANPLWDDYSIEAVPTVIFFENGYVNKRLDGKIGRGLNEKQLNVWLQNFKV